jgi:Protein of unknown function (DUF3135)
MKTLQQAIDDRDNFMSTLPPDMQLKYEQQTWVLEQKLRKHKDPVARMNAMVVLFWEGVAEFNEGLKQV